MKNRYPEADNYGIIVHPSQMGVELYMWAYGHGLEPLTSFFNTSMRFTPIEGIKLGRESAAKCPLCSLFKLNDEEREQGAI